MLISGTITKDVKIEYETSVIGYTSRGEQEADVMNKIELHPDDLNFAKDNIGKEVEFRINPYNKDNGERILHLGFETDDLIEEGYYVLKAKLENILV